jgi:hypothetical protein
MWLGTGLDVLVTRWRYVEKYSKYLLSYILYVAGYRSQIVVNLCSVTCYKELSTFCGSHKTFFRSILNFIDWSMS